MRVLFSTLLIMIAFPVFSQRLKIDISGITTNKGLIQLSVYNNEESFKTETPFRIYNFEKGGMTDGNLTVFITDLEPNVYGIALIDDKNANGKMDYRLFVPTEGFGFSDYQFKGKRKPDFGAFSFRLTNEDKSIHINVQYLCSKERSEDESW